VIATCEGCAESWILWPNGVLGPGRSAVAGDVASLPSEFASTPGLGYTPRCEWTSIRPGVTQWPLAVDDAGLPSALAGFLSDRLDLAINDQHVGVVHPRAPCQLTLLRFRIRVGALCGTR